MLRPLSTLTFWILFMGTGLVIQTFVALRSIFVTDPNIRHHIAQRARLFWSALSLRWFFGIPSLAKLREQSASLPKQFILVVNHRSNLDPLFVFVIGRPLVFLSKKSVLKTPVIGWWMRLCGDIPVERGEKASRERSLHMMKERIARGDSLLIFPEGTRQTDPNVILGPFRDGAFNVAAETGVPIVPLILHKTHTIWKKNSLFLNLSPLRFSFSSPIETRGRTADSIKVETLEKMSELVKSLES